MHRPHPGRPTPRPLRIALLTAILCISGCHTAAPPREALTPGPKALAMLDAPTQERVRQLEAALNDALGRKSKDSYRIAHVSVVRCLQLREEYRETMPAWIHNMGVALHTAPRGYCCHWTRDLLDALELLHTADFEPVWAVARMGTPLEHSCLVAVPRGKGFSDGIVLDGWRHGGTLFWARVPDDREWKWVPRPTRPGYRIDCGGQP
ncbi:MAG: hypothetical protein K8S99_13440 [Planctomycetes bacterium]|nr:hypothetical protein [Planctomycetota bacterium]